jgi:hypothetical protein
MNLLLISMLYASTAGIGAPQFDESGAFFLKLANVVALCLAFVVLWKTAFGSKKPVETTVGPVPLSVKAHEEFITRREFAEIKARTIAVEQQLREVKESMHQTELRLLQAGTAREHAIMERINLLVPEVVRALDRTDRSKGGRSS